MFGVDIVPLIAVLAGDGGPPGAVEADGALTIDWSTALDAAGPRSVALVLGEFGVGLQTARVLGIPGGRLYVSMQGLARSHPDSLVGDVQVFDNIDGDPQLAVASFAYEQRALDERLIFRVGRFDANDTFGVHHLRDDARQVRSRRAFLHSSMGFSPTMLEMPSYPRQAIGALLSGRPFPNVVVDTGIFDATTWRAIELPARTGEAPFSRVFAAVDVGVHWHLRGQLAGNAGAGAWYLSRPAAASGAVARHGTAGPVVGLSQTLFREHGSEGEGVVAFVQYGWSDRTVSDIPQHAGLGLTWVGMLRGRSSDVVGVGVSAVEVDRRLRGGTRGLETAIEAFYGIRVDTFLELKPDLQVIVDPGGQRSGRTSTIFTLRLQAHL